MTDACRFRLYKRGGIACGRVDGGCKHVARGRIHQYILNGMMGSDSKWNWSKAMTYIERAQQYEKANVIEAIEYAIPKRDLCVHASIRGWLDTNEGPTVFLYDILLKMAKLHSRPRFIESLMLLQKKVRKHFQSALRGPWGKPGTTTPVNPTDAFTLAPIEDIPKDMRFSYEASDGRIYAFSAPELSWYILSCKTAMNPFTREPLPKEAHNRLLLLTKKMAKDIVERPATVWRTPSDAFTDVLHGYECMGFYSQLDWFTQLDGDAIYCLYERLEIDRRIPLHLFNLVQIDEIMMSDDNDFENTLRFTLAKTMQKILSHPFETQFYTICKLFLTVVTLNPDPAINRIHDVVPQWLILGAQVPV